MKWIDTSIEYANSESLLHKINPSVQLLFSCNHGDMVIKHYLFWLSYILIDGSFFFFPSLLINFYQISYASIV